MEEKPLNILLVNDYGRPNGGAEIQMISLRAGLRNRGHTVRLLSTDAALVDGFPLMSERSCKGRTDRIQVLTQTINLSARRAMLRELSEFPPDIVHIRMFMWQLSPVILPLLTDVPVLFQAVVFKAICPNGMKMLPDGSVCSVRAGSICRKSGCVATKTWMASMAQLALLRRWRSAIDNSTAVSSRVAKIFRQNGWPEMSVLPNGVDARQMRPALSQPPTVAYAGRLSREKGLETLIDAFAKIALDRPKASLLIAGAGPLDAALRSRAAGLRARIKFLGHLSQEDLEIALQSAWVQVVPSLWHEPFGNVVTEAMARGTAVIASNVGGHPDIVAHNTTGYLVAPGDTGALGARMAQVLDDRQLANRLGAEGRRVARRDFSREKNLDVVLNAYAETMRKHAMKNAGD